MNYTCVHVSDNNADKPTGNFKVRHTLTTRRKRKIDRL
jgi:hypothetical protein